MKTADIIKYSKLIEKLNATSIKAANDCWTSKGGEYSNCMSEAAKAIEFLINELEKEPK